MKNFRGIIIVVAIGAMASIGWAEQVSSSTADLAVIGQLYAPGDDDVYSDGFGIEIQGRFWEKYGLGYGFAAGFAGWGVEDQSVSLTDGINSIDMNISGSVAQLPIGLSAFYGPELGDKISINLEGGFRYVLINSQADVDFTISDGITTVSGSEELEIENGLIGLIAAEVEFDVSETVGIVFGAGYQFDIVKGDVLFFDEELDENELEAFFVRIGITIDMQ